MRSGQLLSRSSIALSLTALSIALSGAAFAAVESGSTGSVIRACVASRTGVVRISDHCARGQRRISWNQTGPAGPSNGYYKTVYNPQGSAAGTFTVSIAVPKGDYIATGGCTATNGAQVGTTPSFLFATASLSSSDQPPPPNLAGRPPEWDAAASVPSQGTFNPVGTGDSTEGAADLQDSRGFKLPKGGQITQTCDSPYLLAEIHVTAIKVGALTGSTTDQGTYTGP